MIAVQETVQLHGAVSIKVPRKVIDPASYLRKIQIKYLICSLQRCGVLPYPQITEQAPELVFLRKVIVAAEHIQEEALAETARTDENQVMGLVFQ